MRNFHHFLNKLACALIAVIAISGCFEPLDNNILSSNPNQVVYAKKAKKVKKAKRAKKHAKKSAKKTKKVNASTDWRWPKPKATVYLDLDGNKNLLSASDEAIKTWNDTGAFTFVKTKNKKNADITVEQVYSPNTNYAGYTTFHYYVKSGLLFSANTKLNTYYLDNFSSYNYSYERVVNTVEHELGHAIGLKHNNGQSVMYPTGSIYPIQDIDIQNVKKLYAN